ncbi:hypothetical protein C8Q70DRAFT_272722 [Cubamyces menziesii]|nr:hypothetical protein C8Q70DRAFT_272722 [Cubamyces menziesii]
MIAMVIASSAVYTMAKQCTMASECFASRELDGASGSTCVDEREKHLKDASTWYLLTYWLAIAVRPLCVALRVDYAGCYCSGLDLDGKVFSNNLVFNCL